MGNALDYLRSDAAAVQFAFKGQLGEASKAIEPVLQAFEAADTAALPKRIGKVFQKQTAAEIARLKRAGLKRVIRITDAKLSSSQNKNSLGFTRMVDASGEWRECEITAAVLDRYIDIGTGECIIEKFDESARLTLRQSRHIKASDQSKAKNSKKDVYIREQLDCPSCGAQLVHIADNTSCPYCGASITFNFFDWQLDSFYLDMRKASLLDEAKVAAGKAAAGFLNSASKAAELLADSMDKKAARTRNRDSLGYDNRFGAALTVIIFIVLLAAAALFAMPWYVRAALGIAAAALIVTAAVKYLKKTEQKRKKKKIVRYSDPYLRSCVYDEIWRSEQQDSLIGFSVDEIILKSVENTESTTSIEVVAEIIKRLITPERSIDIVTQEVGMRLNRARYPERKKNKGKIMEEKECPSCGANFEPDENNCCSYCGYGLKIENYIWKRVR